MSLPSSVQLLYPKVHAVLPNGFQRHPFKDTILCTDTTAALGNKSSPFVATHPSFLALLGPAPSVRVLAAQDRSFAHEAGVWVPTHDGAGEVWFTSNLYDGPTRSDGLRERTVEVSRINLGTGKVNPVQLPVYGGNGACPYGDYLLFCDQGAGRGVPSALTLVDPSNPADVRPILNNFHGRAFNSLNDVIVLPPRSTEDLPGSGEAESSRLPARGSTVWFTDPTYGHEQGFRHTPELPSQVYVFNPETGDIRAVADGFDHPNGICFSPDGKTCYVTDTAHIRGCGTLDPHKPSTIYAFDVVWPGVDLDIGGPSLQNRRLFAFADCGVPDGIKCDTLGNVYSGCGDGVHVWNKYGTLVGKIVLGLADDNIGAGCANFCFVPGGKLVCFAENRIYLVEGLAVEGALL
ncbi:hypothetical protein CcaverHIS002_0706110 [Cutaneotrichosporon cavernicola]|uniref:SMP-30/Gluconolactonase/LRE-like region domain-containing protein n=1 Tax=Cutaneotrichosporon cavernicola TaxID=279322 RepID=A0AA48LAQ5_9TREE|nr:uncharacterized protein CcaverHIS019_0706150 [Cutaneotrichosporon cavernicola]BEI87265.1 hypothetical protein CcaverHIS002_0706110 [Cutaneotrichosporon cavernicola]BEI95034.1 hypothetical protein CcaverHIS019_0706150 [Cutaneotrichosporon cavernicola]BEJ02808.1 hypothetical protein CcaverHIS631_0706030 [Cutaneotrichosporon cavernicola]BEJ10561.1 hypothetical protein CcaverHIS641_0705960 [Cutaneotrichosporon cavernicola]